MKTVFALLLAFAASAVGAQPIDLPPGPAVRTCDSPNCMDRQWALPIAPPAPKPVEPSPDVVIAPVAANGQPAAYVQICDGGSCRVVKAPAVVVQLPKPANPPAVYWYQPPTYNVPKVVTWEVWNTMGGPPLRRR